MAMTEQIGKITLDYTHYPGEDLYCDGEIEEELLEIAKTYGAAELQGVIEERNKWPVLYHFSHIRENIVDWLPMDKSMKVLEVGSGCGAITGKLSEKCGEVTCIDLSRQRSRINAYRHMECDNVTIHVGNFRDIEPGLPCDYDYVCLIGVFEYGQSYIDTETPFHDFFRIVNRHVKAGGRLVIAIENQFGMKYWAGCREDHLGSFFSSIEGYPEGGGVRTFSRRGLERILQECGQEQYSFYYPYPDYKFMNTLFSDERLPAVGELTDNLRNFDRDRLLLFDEKNAFDAVIREGMFPFYSNSFLVITGQKPAICYSRYSNDRSLETGIRTDIIQTEEGKVVRKTALTPYSGEHVRKIMDSYRKLSRRYQGSRLSVNRCELHDGELPYVELEYVEGVTLSELLDECLKKHDEEGFFSLFEDYVERISYGKEMPITNYDCIFSNILVQGDQWTLIDYEWTLETSVEPSEIAFRSLYCYVCENEKRNCLDMGRALVYIGISEQDAEEYRQKEVSFQKQVMGRRLSLGQIREQLGHEVFEPVKWMGKFEERRGRDRIQIYEDRGEGYREEDSYFLKDPYSAPNRACFTLTFSEEVKHLRIDPAMEACIVKIEKLLLNDVPLPAGSRRLFTVNGAHGGETFVFSTEDPNINLHVGQLPLERQNRLEAELVILPMDSALTAALERELKRKIRL